MTRTRTAITALTLVSVLALGACSDDDPEPKFAPTPSTSAPTSAPTSPSTTAASGLTEPSTADDLTQRGAQTFLAYWFEVLSQAMVSGDTTAVGDSSEKTCTSCSALIRQIDLLYAKGGRVETDGWTVENSAVNGTFTADAPKFLLRVSQAKRLLYDGDKLVDRTPMTKVPMQVELSSETGSWLVSRLEILQ